MAVCRVEEMDETRDTHPRRPLRQVFRVLQRRQPECLVAPMQKEPMEYFGCAREVEEVFRVQVPEDLDMPWSAIRKYNTWAEGLP